MPKREGSLAANRRRGSAIACAALLAAALGAPGCASAPSTGATADDAEGSGGIVVDVAGMDRTYTDRDRDPSYDAKSATRIELAGATAAVEGEGVQVSGGLVTITEPGTYVVAGELSQGQLSVSLAGSDDKAQVVLAGAAIRNESGPALYVRDADKVFLTLADGTENRLADGEAYELEADSDEPYATLFSRADLTINGAGSLVVEASYRHGICSKDDLVVTGGSLAVSAPEDALRGRDCVKVLAGSFDLTAGENAIKSNKDDDPMRGFVSLDGGTFAISAGDDAVHGETALFAGDATVTVSQCYEGYEAQQVYIEGGEHSIVASDDAVNASAIATDDGTEGQEGDGATAAAEPAAGAEVPGQGASEREGGMQPPEGNPGTDQEGRPGRTLQEGDGQPPEPPADGKDAAPSEGQAGNRKGGFGEQGGPGGAMAGANEDCLIQISGGRTVLDAGGDAVDSNGSIRITGGELYATGPASSADAALDYEFEATVEGGVVLMVGPAGMAETFTGGTQPFALVQASGAAGDLVEVTAADGTVVASFTAVRAFQAVNVSAPGLGEDEACQLVVAGSATSFTASTTPSATRGPGAMGGGRGEGAAGVEAAMGDEGAPPELPEGAEPPEGFGADEPPARPDGEGGPQGAPQDDGGDQGPGADAGRRADGTVAA